MELGQAGGRVGLGRVASGGAGLSGVEWSGVGLGSAGEGLGMHWGAIKLLYYMTLILLNCQAKTTPKQPWARPR